MRKYARSINEAGTAPCKWMERMKIKKEAASRETASFKALKNLA
jgi:hypothetical protein